MLSSHGFRKQGAGLFEKLRLIAHLLSCEHHRPRESTSLPPPIVYYWLASDTLPDLIQFIGLAESDGQLSHCEDDDARKEPWTELAIDKLKPGRLYHFYSAVSTLRSYSREAASHSTAVKSFMEFLKTQLNQGPRCPRDRREAIRMAQARDQLWHKSRLNIGVGKLEELDKEKQYLNENSLESDSESEHPAWRPEDNSEALPDLTSSFPESSLHKIPIQTPSFENIPTAPKRSTTLEISSLRSKRDSVPEFIPTLVQHPATTSPPWMKSLGMARLLLRLASGRLRCDSRYPA